MKRTKFKRKAIRTKFPEKRIQVNDNFHLYLWIPTFKNMTPGSIHSVIPFPGYWPVKACTEGVCVSGADGRPIKLHIGEFKYLANEKN